MLLRCLALAAALLVAAPAVAGADCIRRDLEADTTGLVRAKLTGPSTADWDVVVRDRSSGRRVAASSHFGSTELAEGFITEGQRLRVRACRRHGSGAADLSVRTVTLPPAPRGGIRLARVSTPTPLHKDLLLSLGLDLSEHGRENFLEVVLHGDEDVAVLRRSGLQYDVVVDDLAAADRQALRSAGPPDGAMPSGRVDYRRLPDFGADMKALAEANPKLVKPLTLPFTSLEGRPVEGVEITEDVTAADGKPVFLNMGVHHAREWPSAEMAMEFAFELVNKYTAGDERAVALLKKARVIVVPVVNPDGYNLSREAPVDGGSAATDVGFAYKRRNCRVLDGAIPAAGECALQANRDRGVDPNRNYGGFWGGPGASASERSDTYRGAAPFSEPETQNVKWLVSSRQATTLITNHTYADLVLRPPGQQGGPVPPDEPIYKELGDAMAAQNGYTSQRGFELYDTTGTTEDWSYYATGGLGFTFEIGRYDNIGGGSAVTGAGFHPPYPSVVAEWYGKYPTGGGNREAYYIALEWAADPARHSVLTGSGRPGATLRLHKEFDGHARLGEYKDVLDSTTVVPPSGTFEWHVNPSTRPAVQAAGGTEAWTLTCELDGTVYDSQQVTVGRGQTAALGQVCASAPALPKLGLTVRAGKRKKRSLAVRVACTEACETTLRLLRGRRVVASRTLSVTAPRRVRLKAPRRGKLRLVVDARTADGRTATFRRRIRG